MEQGLNVKIKTVAVSWKETQIFAIISATIYAVFTHVIPYVWADILLSLGFDNLHPENWKVPFYFLYPLANLGFAVWMLLVSKRMGLWHRVCWFIIGFSFGLVGVVLFYCIVIIMQLSGGEITGTIKGSDHSARES